MPNLISNQDYGARRANKKQAVGGIITVGREWKDSKVKPFDKISWSQVSRKRPRPPSSAKLQLLPFGWIMSAKVNTLTRSSVGPRFAEGATRQKRIIEFMGVRREWKNNRAFVTPRYPPRRQAFVPADTRLTADHSRRKVAASEGCRLIDMDVWNIFHMFLAILVIFRHDQGGHQRSRGRFKDNVRNGQAKCHRRTHDQAITPKSSRKAVFPHTTALQRFVWLPESITLVFDPKGRLNWEIFAEKCECAWLDRPMTTSEGLNC